MMPWPTSIAVAAISCAVSPIATIAVPRGAFTTAEWIEVITTAHELGIRVVALTGNGGGKMKALMRKSGARNEAMV